MNKPMVSVIMGVFNQRDEEVLKTAVSSILNQTYQNFEFIIWDDGSEKEAAQHLLSLPAMDERIILAGREENRGLAFSLNECIRLAKGTYIARMDADDISKPERFERQVAFLEEHPEYGWCGTNAELFDEKGVWGYRSMQEIPQKKDYYQYSPYIHPSVMFRAELFDEHRGYLATEETLRCEDYEIFMNLVECGQKGYNLQEKLFCYRETRESYQKRKFCFRWKETKTRYHNFKKLGILFPTGWFYVLRPIIACLIPTRVLEFIKRTEGILSMKKEINRVQQAKNGEIEGIETNRISKKNTAIPENHQQKYPAYENFGTLSESARG